MSDALVSVHWRKASSVPSPNRWPERFFLSRFQFWFLSLAVLASQIRLWRSAMRYTPNILFMRNKFPVCTFSIFRWPPTADNSSEIRVRSESDAIKVEDRGDGASGSEWKRKQRERKRQKSRKSVSWDLMKENLSRMQAKKIADKLIRPLIHIHTASLTTRLQPEPSAARSTISSPTAAK